MPDSSTTSQCAFFSISSVAQVSFVVVGALATVCMLSYRLYFRRAFLLLTLGWVVNLAYIIWAAIGSRYVSDSHRMDESIYACGLISSFFFFFAAREFDPRHPIFRRLSMILLLATVVVAVTFGFVVANSSAIPTDPKYLRFLVMTSPGVAFSMATLLILARSLHRKRAADFLRALKGESLSAIPYGHKIALPQLDVMEGGQELDQDVEAKLDISRRFLVGALLCYAILQPAYPFRDLIGEEGHVFLYYLGAIIKIALCFGFYYWMQADVRNLADQASQVAVQKEVTDEITALTFSIEHDIRNPLATIQAIVAPLRRQHSSSQYLNSELLKIEEELDRIAATTAELPAMRESKEFYRKHSVVADLIEILRAVIKVTDEEWKKTSPRITFETQKERIEILGYRERLERALVNVLNNGVEACLAKDDGNPPRIKVACICPRGRDIVFVTITDYGIGIPRDNLAQVTKALFTTKDVTERTNRGMGLFSAQRILRQHRGDLTIDSDGSSFTRVTIQLPRYQRKRGQNGGDD